MDALELEELAEYCLKACLSEALHLPTFRQVVGVEEVTEGPVSPSQVAELIGLLEAGAHGYS